jgi:hypothetical protein
MHLALRELRDEFCSPVTLAALAGVAIVVGISGPFGTLEALPLILRLAYWGFVVPLTYGAGFLGTLALQPYLPGGPRALRCAISAFGAAVPVALVLALLHSALGVPLGQAGEIALGFVAVYVICLVIDCLGAVLQSASPAAQPFDPAPKTPALLLRLPIEKRGTLLAISAQDHYITVITTKGQEMVLMRLVDAMTEAAPLRGVQIHRSHWVALFGVTRVTRSGDGALAHLANGHTLPIARSRLKAARQAGLLPRKAN